MLAMPSIQEGKGRDTEEMIRCLQVNLNHCKAAQDILGQTVNEHAIDVVLINEPYKTQHTDSNWIFDPSKRAAIWVCGKYPFEELPRVQQDGFVHAKIANINFFSCYASPNDSIGDLENLLDRIALEVRTKNAAVVAGDFNAWATEWGSPRTSKRGMAVLDAFASLDILLLNQGAEHTFDNGRARSVIDLTFASYALARQNEWKVSGIYTHSDHKAITFEVGRNRAPPRHPRQTVPSARWATKKIDLDVPEFMLENIQPTLHADR